MKKSLIILAVLLAPALFAASPSFQQTTNIVKAEIVKSNAFTGTFTGNGSGLTGVKVADTNITGTITVTNGQLNVGTFNSSGSTIKSGSLEIQSYALNNAWIGENIYFGSAWTYRTTGYSGLFLFQGSEGQFRFSPSGIAGSNVVQQTAQFKVNQDGTVALGGQINTLAGNYTGASLIVNSNGNGTFTGTVTARGFASTSSNTLALASISFPATTVNWTNTFGKNIFVFIDNAGVTGTALKINGTQISSTLVVTGDTMLPLQPGEYFSETYTIGTPVAVWKPQ